MKKYIDTSQLLEDLKKQGVEIPASQRGNINLLLKQEREFSDAKK